MNFFCLFNVQNVRVQLEASLPGTGGGENPTDAFRVKLLFLLPFVLILFCYYRSFLQVCNLNILLLFRILGSEHKYPFFKLFSCLQERSLCDHVRHLYYKFKSGGVLSYSAVSSSTFNSNQQVSLLPCNSSLILLIPFLVALPFSFQSCSSFLNLPLSSFWLKF